MKDQQIKNEEYQNLIMIVISSRILVEFISALLGSFFRVSSTSMITLVIFAIILVRSVYTVIKGRIIRVRDLGWLIGIYTFYFVNYMISDLKYLFFEQSMILLYLFYIPFSIFIIANVSDWSTLRPIAQKYLRFDLIIGLLTCFIALTYRSVRLTENSTYMTFSYAFLPIICLTFLVCNEKMDWINFALAIASVVSMLLYGARMCVFLAVIYFVFVNYIYVKGVKRLVYILLGITGYFIIINLLGNNMFLNSIERLAGQYNSHILTAFLRGTLFTSTSREAIYDTVRYAIRNMGDNVYGMFGDRHFTSSYSHSIIYESILSFGWFGGITFLALNALLFIKAVIASFKNQSLLECILFFVCFFCKFFVSSSFATDWFYIFYVGFMLSIIRIKPCNTAIGEA